MATTVKINLEGRTAEDALTKDIIIDNAASEETLKKILDILTTFSKSTVFTTAGKPGTPGTSGAGATSGPARGAAPPEANIGTWLDMFYGKQRALMILTGAMSNTVQKATGMLLNFTNETNLVDAALTLLPPQLRFWGMGIIAAKEAIERLLKPLVELNNKLYESAKVGAAFNNNLMELRSAAARAGISLENFAKLVAENSVLLAQYGGTVTQGALIYANLSNKVLKKYGNELNAMGVGMDEINSTIPLYLDAHKAGSAALDNSKKATDKQAESFTNLVKEVDIVAKLTGKQREAMMNEINKKTQDAAYQMKIARMTEAQRTQLQATMVRMHGQFGDLGSEVVKLTVLGMPPLTEEMRLAKATLGPTWDAISGITNEATKGNKTWQEFNKDLDEASVEAVATAMASADNLESVLAAGAANLGGTSDTLNKTFTAIYQQTGKYADMTDADRREALKNAIIQARAEQRARDRLKMGLDSFTNSMRILVSSIWDNIGKPIYTFVAPIFFVLAKAASAVAWALTLVVNAVGWLMRPFAKLGEWISNLIDGISDIVDALGRAWDRFTELPGIKQFGEVLSSIGDKITKFYENFGAVILGIISAYALYKIGLSGVITGLGAMTKGIWTFVRSLLAKIPIIGKIFGTKPTTPTPSTPASTPASTPSSRASASTLGKTIADLGKGIGSFISSVGKGAGEAIKGILKGIASGIESLGTTKVLKGTVALIGLGAALFVAGHGIKQFISIKWEDMAKALVALTGLAAVARMLDSVKTAVIRGALAIGILGAALIPATFAFKIFNEVKWEGVASGIAALGALTIAALSLDKVKAGIIRGAAAIGILGAALIPAAFAFRMFNDVNWESLGKATLSLAGLAAISLMIGKAAGSMIIGALAIAVLGAALIPAAYSFKMFEEISWEAMGKAAASIVGLALAAALIGMPVVLPFILSGALGIAALGASLLPLAAAVALAAPAVDQILASLVKVKDIAVGNLMLIGPALTSFAAGMAVLSAGGLISGVIDSLGSLFGSKSPFEKLAELGKAGEGLKTVATSIERINTALDKVPTGDKIQSIVLGINALDASKLKLLMDATASVPSTALPAATSTETSKEKTDLIAALTTLNETLKDFIEKTGVEGGGGTVEAGSNKDIVSAIGEQTSTLSAQLDSMIRAADDQKSLLSELVDASV